jgi:hypothetical protein
MGNAIKFTKQGMVSLVVQSLNNNKIRFDIIDSGVGIASENLFKIFESFEQVGDPIDMQSGTGLGLSISKKLVAKMGGQLNVTSTLAKGSNFWLEIDLPTYISLTPINLDAEDEYYEVTSSSNTSQQFAINKVNAINDIVIPPQCILQELLELTEMGDLQALKKRLTHLEQSDVELSAFTKELNNLIQNFQIHKILSCLNTLIN